MAYEITDHFGTTADYSIAIETFEISEGAKTFPWSYSGLTGAVLAEVDTANLTLFSHPGGNTDNCNTGTGILTHHFALALGVSPLGGDVYVL